MDLPPEDHPGWTALLAACLGDETPAPAAPGEDVVELAEVIDLHEVAEQHLTG